MLTSTKVDEDYAYFIEKVKSQTGIDLFLYKEKQMRRRLDNLRVKRGFDSFLDFFRGMMGNTVLYKEFLDHMTINVTEFYRNPNRWDVLEKQILPELPTKNAKIKCWSAACSTGEEPYSLVMALSSLRRLQEIQVLATDIDQAAIHQARIGRYPWDSVKNVPLGHLHRFFKSDFPYYHISEEIKRCVQFKAHNLLADPFKGDFDLIICRNVLIYFTDKAKQALFEKFSRSLKPGGYIFIGGTEQIFQPQNYQLENVATFFYRKL